MLPGPKSAEEKVSYALEPIFTLISKDMIANMVTYTNVYLYNKEMNLLPIKLTCRTEIVGLFELQI